MIEASKARLRKRKSSEELLSSKTDKQQTSNGVKKQKVRKSKNDNKPVVVEEQVSELDYTKTCPNEVCYLFVTRNGLVLTLA